MKQTESDNREIQKENRLNVPVSTVRVPTLDISDCFFT